MDRVILRRFRGGEDGHVVIALLLDNPAMPGMVDSYLHVGQHGEATRGIVNWTRPASIDEPDAAALVAELTARGYEPRIVKRLRN